MNITAKTAIQQVTDTLYAPVRYTGSGVPEGVVNSDPGWCYLDTDKGTGLWVKKTGTGNTGWKAMGSVLVSNYTTSGNTNASPVDLQLDYLPAGVLAANGDSLVCRYSGQIVGSNIAIIALLIGGQSASSHVLTPGSSAFYTVEAQLFRTGTTTVRVVTKTFVSIEGSAAVTTFTSIADLSSLDLAGSLSVALHAQPLFASPNSVTKFTGFIELKPAP